MAKRASGPAASSGVRRGTATRRAGKKTAEKLVEAAHDLLETQSYERFSMRSVAEHAGVSLANLQYYFPLREDLARALYIDIGDRYLKEYRKCLEGAADDPLERFKIVLAWNMQDISKKSTRQFFIQFWTLLGSLDDFDGNYLDALYAIDIAQLSELIRAIKPGLEARELEQRATLIAAMIEGLLVVTGNLHENNRQRKSLYEAAFNTALEIACRN